MRFPNVTTDTIRAFEMYHNTPYFCKRDVVQLFACGSNTAIRIKKLVKEEMEKREIKLYCERDQYIDRDVLYELAGLDINAINKSYKKLKEVEQ